MLANMVYRVSPSPSSFLFCRSFSSRLVEGEKLLKEEERMRLRTRKADRQGYMKGYISHEKSMVVLAKTNPFPNLNSIAR